MAYGKSKRERLATALRITGSLGALQRAQRRRPARQLSVLTYHRLAQHTVDDGPYFKGCINATDRIFRKQLALLARFHHVVSLPQVVDAVRVGKPLPPSPVLITFDDGYRSCADIALPALRDFGMSATFFVPTQFVDRREVFGWDRISYLLNHSDRETLTLDYPRPLKMNLRPREAAVATLTAMFERSVDLDHRRFFAELETRLGTRWDRDLERRCADELVMTWDQVRSLRDAGMSIESHTRSHRVLQTLPASALRDELAGSRQDLLEHAGVDSTTIAYPAGYPVGDDPTLREAVMDAGYRTGFSFGGGINRLDGTVDHLNIRRSPVNSYHSQSMFRMQLALPSLAYVSPRAVAFEGDNNI